MGVTISFTRVTPEQLAAVEAAPDSAWDLLDQLAHDPLDGCLDKTWNGLQFLFARAGIGLDVPMDGDMLDDEGCLFGWGVAEIARVAEELRGTSWEKLAVHYDPAELSRRKVYPMLHLWDVGDAEYLEGGYQTLVNFFDTTAATGSAAIMQHSF